MNELQEQAIKNLQVTNIKYIEEIEKLQCEINSDYDKFTDFKDELFNYIDKMEEASSNVPFSPYNNLYCYSNGELSIPVRPCFKDSVYGEINEEYEFLTSEYMEKTEKRIYLTTKEIKKILSGNVQRLDELLDKVIASNSITKRLSGLQDKINELQKDKTLLWYHKDLSVENYSYKGKIPIPPCCLDNIQMVLPFHRKLAINNEYLFKTMELHLQVLKDIKARLLYINEFLPFAELI